MPANESEQVACPPDEIDTDYTPPVVTDNCGRELSWTGPVESGDYNGCSGDIIWTYTYQDCADNTYEWTYTFTVADPVVNMPASETETVDCPSEAIAPEEQTILDNCGRELEFMGMDTDDQVGDECHGNIVYTYTTVTVLAQNTHTLTHLKYYHQ